MKPIFHWRKLFQYFLQGLLIVAPVLITGYLIYWLVTSLDNLLPIFTVTNEKGEIVTRNYGLGIAFMVGCLMLIGFISSNFFAQRILDVFDGLLENIPGVKTVYSSVKDFFEAFAGNKKKFTKAVLVSVDDNDIWRIGFVTRKDMTDFGLPNHVTVYVPQSYAIAGVTYLVPRERVKLLENIPAADAMKFAVSGGVVEVDE
jgi:uncharacterized membrane protein